MGQHFWARGYFVSTVGRDNIPLVREALRERGLLARNAPHVVSTLGFVVPAYRRRDKPLYVAGLKVYDWLAGPLNLARSRGLSAAKTREELPTLVDTLHGRPLRGGTLYYDGQFDDARLAISLMRTVFDLGGIALNNAEVRGVSVDSRRKQHLLVIKDAETGNHVAVRARCVVNATGVWVDAIRAMVEPSARPIVAPSQGVHPTLPARFLQSCHALLVPKADDGRVLFAGGARRAAPEGARILAEELGHDTAWQARSRGFRGVRASVVADLIDQVLSRSTSS